MMLFSIFIFALLYFPVEAAYGFDTTHKVSVEDFKCLEKNGYSFYIGRIYQSKGEIDENGIQNIKNARKAGWKFVDGFIFPCLKEDCPSASKQMEKTLKHLSAKGGQIGTIWIDIQDYNGYWPVDKINNQNFITDLKIQAEALIKNIGIYTQFSSWNKIVGAEWKGVADKLLWWPRYNDKEEDFSEFEAFGGWIFPTIHQFTNDFISPQCNVTMNRSWRP